jgi:hypothetical protein
MLVLLRLGILVRVLAVVAVVVAVVALLLVGRAPTGTNFQVPGTAPISIDAAGKSGPFRVVNTGNEGLNVRSCPDSACPKVGWIREGGEFAAGCWRQGTAVSGDRKWLSGTVNGKAGFASAHYLEGAPVPSCDQDVTIQS